MEGHGCRSGSLYGPLLGSCQQGNEIWACIISEQIHVYHINSFDEQSTFMWIQLVKSTRLMSPVLVERIDLYLKSDVF